MSTEGDTVFTLAGSATHLLHRAQQLAANKSASALKEAGLTIRQFALLEALSENEGVSQSQLVDATSIDRSTLADMVSRMETAGLLARERSEADARTNMVSLTDAGRKALDISRPAVAAADEELLRILPKNRRVPFLTILTLMADESDVTLLDLEVAPEGDGRKVKKKKKAKAAPDETAKVKQKSGTKDQAKTKSKGKKKKKK